MISIVIPVFNRDVNKLVWALSQQVELLTQKAEIIVIDDGSEPGYHQLHRNLNSIPFVRYLLAGSNNGRIRIRQILAGLAIFEWLLFLDCDNEIVSDTFLETYCNRVKDAIPVLVGGRIYIPETPKHCNIRLHWKYGRAREKTIPGKKGYTNRFMTNNFCIRKSVFDRFNFDGGWDGYGYEDTWMGIQLEAMGIAVTYIDNPVLHTGLEPSLLFLDKSREALRNLQALSKMVPDDILIKHVRLYSYYYHLSFLRLSWLLNILHIVLHKIITRNLHSCNPSLIIFDFYRLSFFAILRNSRVA